MSYELDYFAPKPFIDEGWQPKPLKYGCWKKILFNRYPAHIQLSVDLIDGNYKWCVEVFNWNGTRSQYDGTSSSSSEACKKAEEVGKEHLDALTPEWVILALKNNWTPPGY
jgi:hypothetical protein